MNHIEEKILSTLLDKFENSKTFISKNKNTQKFQIAPEQIFKKYNDDSDFKTFQNVNTGAKELEKQGFVHLNTSSNRVIQKITLNLETIDNAYSYLGRTQKKDTNIWLMEQFSKYENSDGCILQNYIHQQINRMEQNKSIEYFSGDYAEFENILNAVPFIEQHSDEIFIRDASIKLFNDSKILEAVASKVQNLMFQYGGFQDSKTVFEECGIVKTPTYVMIKGAVELVFKNQTIDLSLLNGDIALSTMTMKDLQTVNVKGKQVVTIENLTSFHNYCNKETCSIYLGGFHSRIKRSFLQVLYKNNHDVSYFHFGDIDAGGFYIFEHLCEKTTIPFQMLHMDIKTLQENKSNWKQLTANDKVRLEKMQEKDIELNKKQIYRDVIQFMLQNNCKLEQEAIDLFR